jgi:hypothetical protein
MATINTITAGNIINIDTNLYSENIVVMLSSIVPSARYTITDIGGNYLYYYSGTPISLTISTSVGSFLDGSCSVKMAQPYDSLTCVQITSSLWQVIPSTPITDTSIPRVSTLQTQYATCLSTLYTSTFTSGYISTYGTITASSITNNGILYASISTISTAISALETTDPFNYTSISTMSTILSTASNAPYNYITSTIVATSSLLLSTYRYNYITTASLRNAVGYMSTFPGLLTSIDAPYLAGCTSGEYVYYANPSLSTTNSMLDVPGGILVSMSNDAGGNNNIWCANNFITNNMAGNVGSIVVISDESLKHDVQTLVSSLDRVNELRGVSYQWRGREKQHIGFIAQEVETVIPDVVRSDMSDLQMKGVRYKAIVAPLIEAIKEIDILLSDLEEKVYNA